MEKGEWEGGTWRIYENLAVENFRWEANYKKNHAVRLGGGPWGKTASNAAISAIFSLGSLRPVAIFSPIHISHPFSLVRLARFCGRSVF